MPTRNFYPEDQNTTDFFPQLPPCQFPPIDISFPRLSHPSLSSRLIRLARHDEYPPRVAGGLRVHRNSCRLRYNTRGRLRRANYFGELYHYWAPLLDRSSGQCTSLQTKIRNRHLPILTLSRFHYLSTRPSKMHPSQRILLAVIASPILYSSSYSS